MFAGATGKGHGTGTAVLMGVEGVALKGSGALVAEMAKHAINIVHYTRICSRSVM